MRVGIFIDHLHTVAVTASHLEQSLLFAFDNCDSEHEFIVFTWSKLTNENCRINKKLQYVNITESNRLLNKIYRRSNNVIKNWIELYISKIARPHNYEEQIYCLKQNVYNVALLQYKIDIVYSMFGSGFRICEIPYIANCLDCNEIKHPYLPEFNVTIPSWNEYDRLRAEFFRRSTYVVASTKALKNQLIRFYGIDKNKIYINHFFVSKLENIQSFFEPDTKFKDTIPEKYLFFPARYIPQKNHILILLALKELKNNRNIHVNLVCVGIDKGNLKYLKCKTKEYDLEDRVFFYDCVSHNDLGYLYKKAIALVFPALNGPDNLPPIEAMSYDCPVIASKLEGSSEQFGDAALTFEMTNEIELADKIQELLNDSNLRETLIARGRVCIKNKTPEIYVSNILKIIDNFAKKRRAWDEGYFHLLPNFKELS